jgi:hypothetical protein
MGKRRVRLPIFHSGMRFASRRRYNVHNTQPSKAEAPLNVIVTLLVGLSFLHCIVSAACLEAKDAHTTASIQQPAVQNAKSSQPPIERLIHALSGEWSAEEVYDPSDLLPAGGKGRSRDSYRAGPARLSVVEEYHGDGAPGKSWGTGIIWWEAQDHGFHFIWCDSYALDRGCTVSSQPGKWDGDDFVLTNVRQVSGKQVVEREVWSSITPNSFVQTLYLGEAPDKLKRFVTITARRVVKR